MSQKPKTIEDVLAKLIAHPVWNKTFILRASKKKIQHLLDELAASVVENAVEHDGAAQERALPYDPETMQLVYVFLFQSRDPSCRGWGKALQMLSSSASGRPIYLGIEQAEKRLEHLNHVAEAGYACIAVPQSHIIQATGQQPVKDNLGQRLVSLERGAIQPQYIQYFFFKNQKYAYTDGQLIASVA